MGCSASKLEDEEAVQICKDRRNFIKQAIEQRNRFASGHLAYIESMRRVSVYLFRFVEADDLHYLLSDSYSTPPFTPVKRLSPEITGIPLKSFTATPDEKIKSTFRTVNYLISDGNPSVVVEELPEVHETVRIESYYPVGDYGFGGFFTSHTSPVNTSPSFSSPFNRISHEAQSPPASSQWDYFWNPFSSLDPYGYPLRSSFESHRIENDEDMVGLRHVREAEGIPELEEDIEDDDESVENVMFWKVDAKNETPKTETKHTGVQVGDETPASSNGDGDIRKIQEVKELKSREPERVEALETRNAVDLEVPNRREVAGNSSTEKTPGFTVYVNRSPGSMAEVMKDMENQFRRICECAHEISVMLEASQAQYYPASNELAVRMLNPAALFRTTSSRSSSFRFLQASSAAKGDGYQSSSDYSEESCMISGSHQSTLDRLYAWEKKLYEEVKSGERVRIAYEKKCMQLRSHDINGVEHFVVDKTRAAIRDLHTRLKVSINTVQAISKRIEALRDLELYPQLMELIQGLFRMWKTMADCHRIQKRTIDEAKLLLFSGAGAGGTLAPPKPARAAAGLAAELRNWRSCLANWIDSQRCYAKALAGWASRCLPEDAGDASGRRKAFSPFSPRHGDGDGAGEPPPAFRVCIRWSRLLESLSEARAVEGLDFFAAGIASVSAQHSEATETGGPPEVAAAEVERVAEVGTKVLCAGLAVAVGSLAEHAVATAEGYDLLVGGGRVGT